MQIYVAVIKPGNIKFRSAEKKPAVGLRVEILKTALHVHSLLGYSYRVLYRQEAILVEQTAFSQKQLRRLDACIVYAMQIPITELSGYFWYL